jgi:hypothetical protein
MEGQTNTITDHSLATAVDKVIPFSTSYYSLSLKKSNQSLMSFKIFYFGRSATSWQLQSLNKTRKSKEEKSNWKRGWNEDGEGKTRNL